MNGSQNWCELSSECDCRAQESKRCFSLQGSVREVLSIRLYMVQWLSAMVMIPLTLGHIAVMIYAIQCGLSSAEILGRTHCAASSGSCSTDYFVLAVSLSAAIGLRVIVHEPCGPGGAALEIFTWLFGLSLLTTGIRAVLAVTLS